MECDEFVMKTCGVGMQFALYKGVTTQFLSVLKKLEKQERKRKR